MAPFSKVWSLHQSQYGSKGSDSFSYDQANRLTSATVNGTTETYTYDGDGVRFTRQVGSDPAIRYVTDPNRDLPVTIGDGTRKYVWGLGLAYAVNGSAIEVYHADRLGSTRVLTDGSGAAVATYRTNEFGNLASSTGTSTQPFAFTGEPRDGTGLTYLRARYYDPALGRFMSRDDWGGTVASPETQNRYAYVGGNPVTKTDPSGRFAIALPFVAGVIAYGLGGIGANIVMGRPPLQDLNVADAAIAGVATVAAVAVGGGGALVLAANAAIGYNSTLVSMTLGNRSDPRELLVGTAIGGIGAVFPWAYQSLKGVAAAVTSNFSQNVLNNIDPDAWLKDALRPVTPILTSNGCRPSARVLA